MISNNLDNLIDREITVLMGGWSAEREISLKSGFGVSAINILDIVDIKIIMITPTDSSILLLG